MKSDGIDELLIGITLLMAIAVVLATGLFYGAVRERSRNKSVVRALLFLTGALAGVVGVNTYMIFGQTFDNKVANCMFMAVVCAGLFLLVFWIFAAAAQAAWHGLKDYRMARTFIKRMQKVTDDFVKRSQVHPRDAEAVALQDRLQRMWDGGFDSENAIDWQGLIFCWSELIRARDLLDNRVDVEKARGEALLDALKLVIERLENRNGYGR